VTDLIVGMADLRASARPDDRLVTYALGSCLGIAAYDPMARVGGLLHVMLPSADLDEERARINPALCVDTGVPELLRACRQLGAAQRRLVVTVAGGAAAVAPGEPDQFRIGERNLAELRTVLHQYGVLATTTDVGGHQLSRTMSLAVGDGTVTVRVAGTARGDGRATA
jgi:chemotaxis protein CheD